jgi:hypothetical protein
MGLSNDQTQALHDVLQEVTNRMVEMQQDNVQVKFDQSRIWREHGATPMKAKYRRLITLSAIAGVLRR